MLAGALRDVPPSERTLLELAILRVAYLRRSEYVWKNHARAAGLLGLAADKLRAVSSASGVDERLSAGEWTYVQLADQITLTGGIDDDLWHTLLGIATVEQAVRATATVGVYIAACAIAQTLCVPAESDTADVEERWHD